MLPDRSAPIGRVAVLFNRQRQSWQVRWTEAGITRSKSGFPSRDAASSYRDELLGRPVPESVPDPVASPPSTDSAAPPLDGAGTAIWWQRLHTYLAVELIKATKARAESDVELLGKASRALAALGSSNAQHRDLAELETELEKLRKWQADLTGAATHGTRVIAEAADRAAPGEHFRPEDSVH